MATYEEEFRARFDPVKRDHTYPLGPLDGRTPGPYAAVSIHCPFYFGLSLSYSRHGITPDLKRMVCTFGHVVTYLGQYQNVFSHECIRSLNIVSKKFFAHCL
jgi:hypothetical protein